MHTFSTLETTTAQPKGKACWTSITSSKLQSCLEGKCAEPAVRGSFIHHVFDSYYLTNKIGT